MKNNKVTRRDFFKKTLVSGIAMTTINSNYSCSKTNDDELLGEIKTALLGKTGLVIPRISVGLGSRFCSIQNEEEAHYILNYALDNGLFYWDTAFNYQNNNIISEERIGKVLKKRRNEVFVSTKFGSRTPYILMQNIEKSLERLQTDYFNNIMIHSVGNKEDVEVLSKRGGVIDILMRLKDEGVTRFIGFSSHESAEAIEALLDRADFDIMLIAMDHYNGFDGKREEFAISKALEKGLGILLMKVVRPKETIQGIKSADLIRYALSIEGPTGLVIGMDSMDVVKSNIKILRSFIPMTSDEKAKISSILSPLFSANNFEWNRPDYQDGNWE